MKIKSKIDEIICTNVRLVSSPGMHVSAEFGYLSEGKRCGHVELVGINDPEVDECAKKLAEALEKFFCGVVGEQETQSRPDELKGLIQQEF